MAIPNILAGMECGVTHIDASIGGLGGCPFAPAHRATSAARISCTASTRWVETGVDLDRSSRCHGGFRRSWPEPSWPDREGGKSTRRYPVPDTVAARITTARA